MCRVREGSTILSRSVRTPDSPRWCEDCQDYGDHHTDRHHPDRHHLHHADPSGVNARETRQGSQRATPASTGAGTHPGRLSRSSHGTAQRQDSLSDQMAKVCELAVSAGCYDAHSWIARRFYGDLA